MADLPEESRIAALLRELIAQSGTTLEVVESRLGWERGRLAALLDGQLIFGFDEILEILPLLGATPIEFFAGLYGLEAKEALGALGGHPPPLEPSGLQRQRAMDRLFERSLKAVRKAIARRAAWKRERNGST
jgi:transcriptional regulator with XRE-family HTH domain